MTKEVEAAMKAYKEAGEAWRQARLAEQATWRACRKASLDLLKACAESGGIPAILTTLIAGLLSHYTRDVREAIHLGRLCKTEEDVRSLLLLKYPSKGLF